MTLDGIADIHNKRRHLRSNGGTFNKIVLAIDKALANEIPINLRVVLDKDNINSLLELSNFAIERTWTASVFFKTQLGRNYELHTCQISNNKLFTRLEMYETIYNLLKAYPSFSKFHKPSFSIVKFLFDNSELPDPLFDSCPACKSEWAFDYTGNIYSCTATVGKKDESLGTFYPAISKEEDLINLWQERDIMSIEKCKNCNLQLVCGGGCGSVAKNNNNNILSEDCRPLKEQISLGMSYYFEK